MRKKWLSIILLILCCVTSEAWASAWDYQQTPPDQTADGTTENGVFFLLCRDDAQVMLIVSREHKTASAGFYLYAAGPEEGNSIYDITDITVNGNIRLDDLTIAGTGFAYAAELRINPLFVRNILNMENGLRISCRIAKRDGNYSQIWEETGEAVIPAGFEPDFVFLPYLGVMARKQDVVNNEQIRVTLLGMGLAAGDDGYDLSALFHVENKTGQAIPFYVNGMAVNGVFFAFDHTQVVSYGFDSPAYHIAPHKVCYPYVKLEENAFSYSGISKIGDISLMILTSEDENKGVHYLAGGAFYPVILNGYSSETPELADKELLFQNEWIDVFYDGRTELRESVIYSDAVECEWYLIIRNRSDRDIVLDADFGSLDNYHCYLSNGQIGAGLVSRGTVKFFAEAEFDQPELRILLDGYTEGKGKQLFLDEGPIILPVN